MMDGTFSIDSTLGKGATFAFTMRAGIGTSKADAPSRDVPANIEGLFAGKHILLAEDVDINREIVLALLEPTQVSIDCAENGHEAVKLFSAHPDRYHMIFMDIHMPGLDGYEATKRIRTMDHPWANNIPIIAMTADVFREDIAQAEAAGMNGHVGKPIDLDEVITAMLRWLS